MSKTGKSKVSRPAAEAEETWAETRAQATGERPSDKVIAFAKRHPVIVVAGAIAAGAALSALVPRKTSRRILGKAVRLAEAAGAVGILDSAGDKAGGLGRKARKQAALWTDKAEEAGEATARQLEKYGLAALAAASALGKATAARTGRAGGAASEAADRLGEATSDQGRRVKALAQELRDRIMH